MVKCASTKLCNLSSPEFIQMTTPWVYTREYKGPTACQQPRIV